MKTKIFRTILMMAAAIVLTFTSLTGVVLAAPINPRAASPHADISDEDQTQDATKTRIQFASGETNALMTGKLRKKATKSFILRASAGQLLEITLTAAKNVRLEVTAPSGSQLEALASTSTSFRGYVPATADYIIKLTAGSKAGDFSLFVSVPERVTFESGATSALLDKDLDAGQSHEYILKGLSGQVVEINLTAETGVQMKLYGANGSVLKSSMVDGSVFRARLPKSQDYIFSIRATGDEGSYSMSVIIPQRITFASGATSASIIGKVKTDGSQYYILRALKGQKLKAKITSGKPLELIIYGMDGTVLKSGTGVVKVTLPSTQDYIVVVRTADKKANFTLTVTIP